MNKPVLKSKIFELLKKPVYNNLRINSKGSFLNVLKDNEKLYLLLIPNKPLSDNEAVQILNLGFKEKFPKTNYSKFVDYNNPEALEKLFDDIVFIFNSLFHIPMDREWRYTISSGMGLLKEMYPISTSYERRSKEKSKRFKPKKLFKYDVLLSLIIGVALSLFLITKGIIFGLTIPILFLCTVVFSFVVVKLFKVIETLLDRYRRSRFFSTNKIGFFRSQNFKQVGSRYRGERNGYTVDIYYVPLKNIEIAVYHEEIPWERVIKLSESTKQVWSTESHIFWNTIISKKRIDYRVGMPSGEVIIREVDRLVEKLLRFKINPCK